MGSTIPQAANCALIEDSALPAVEATTPTIRKTALNAVHRQMGAKMVEFNGWDMPVEYPSSGGIVAEHNGAAAEAQSVGQQLAEVLLASGARELLITPG